MGRAGPGKILLICVVWLAVLSAAGVAYRELVPPAVPVPDPDRPPISRPTKWVPVSDPEERLISFPRGESEVPKEDSRWVRNEDELKKVREILIQQPSYLVEIQSTASSANQDDIELAKKRAKNVHDDLLKNFEVASERIRIAPPTVKSPSSVSLVLLQPVP